MGFQNSEIKRSTFNEASLKMQRIDKLQDIINLCSLDRLGKFSYVHHDKETIGIPSMDGKRNFENIFNCICQLLQEVWPKLTNDEQKETSDQRTFIKQIMRKHPVFIRSVDVTGRKVEEMYDDAAWIILDKELVQFESVVRSLIDSHGLSTPDRLDDDGL